MFYFGSKVYFDHSNSISSQCVAVGFFEHSQHVFKPLPFLLPSPSPPEPSLPLDRNVQRERYVKEHYYTVHGIRESPQKNLLVVGCYNDLDSLIQEDVLCPKSFSQITQNQGINLMENWRGTLSVIHSESRKPSK